MGKKRKRGNSLLESTATYNGISSGVKGRNEKLFATPLSGNSREKEARVEDYGTVTPDVIEATTRSQVILDDIKGLLSKVMDNVNNTDMVKKVLFKNSESPFAGRKNSLECSDQYGPSNEQNISSIGSLEDRTFMEATNVWPPSCDKPFIDSPGKNPQHAPNFISITDSCDEDSCFSEHPKIKNNLPEADLSISRPEQPSLEKVCDTDNPTRASQMIILIDDESTTTEKIVREEVYDNESKEIKRIEDPSHEEHPVPDNSHLERETKRIKTCWQAESENDSDEEEDDDGGMADLWKKMNLVVAASKSHSSQEHAAASEIDPVDACGHSFVIRDDIGRFCTLCGFIETSIEMIFDNLWAKSTKVSKKARFSVKRCSGILIDFNDCELSSDNEASEGEDYAEELVLPNRFEKDLKSHQKEGFVFLQNNLIRKHRGCILAHAPGTGKTFLIISFIESFLATFPNEKPLIVAPKSILVSWIKEFKKWDLRDVEIYNLNDVTHYSESLRGNQLCTLKKWKKNKSVLLSSYSLFSSIVCEQSENYEIKSCQQILKEEPGLLVLDEGHFPRNKDTNVLKSLSQIKTRRRVLLSGTLFQNNFKEIFNLFQLVRPNIREEYQGILGKLFGLIPDTEKKPRICRKGSEETEKILSEVIDHLLQCGDESKRKVSETVRKLRSLVVHHYKGEVLEELPGLIDYTVKLKLCGKQCEVLEKYSNITNRMTKEKLSSLVCIHPSLARNYEPGSDPHNSITNFDASNENPCDGAKTKFVMDMYSLCESHKEKLIVFSQYIPPLNLLERMLQEGKKLKKGTQILRLDGKSSLEQRDEAIEKFNEGSDAKVFLASIKASGEGICLTGASRVIILDVPWNPSVTRQAVSRAYRMGQKNKVFAYRLVAAGQLEEEIFERALQKEVMSKMLFDVEDDKNDEQITFKVNVDECEDAFLHSASPLRDNLLGLFQHNVT